ncbi:hypothetical protein [Pasteurella multocida]|uniref:hypothetical protein n=1 Tax=Pasteurella multocida TaxID=747 RepID=UPI00201FEE0C|nr:hypothetical protein [Pasteurella multocida]MCL7759376.1 hypothetical protein [Pasteurella multocida]MDC4237641.1 hypothetical protein [Pasteurella multocida]HDR1113275.1 hypothetical protein [Pasteurella multocida]
MTQLTAQQEKAINAFKFQFNYYGACGLGDVLDAFESESDDEESCIFMATAYALDGAYESGYFEIDNAEAQLEALREHGAKFDFDKALELCEVFFDLVEKGLYEVE